MTLFKYSEGFDTHPHPTGNNRSILLLAGSVSINVQKEK